MRVGSSTLPRTTTRAIETDAAAAAGRSDKVVTATSSTSLYDNVAATQPAQQPPKREIYYLISIQEHLECI